MRQGGCRARWDRLLRKTGRVQGETVRVLGETGRVLAAR